MTKTIKTIPIVIPINESICGGDKSLNPDSQDYRTKVIKSVLGNIVLLKRIVVLARDHTVPTDYYKLNELPHKDIVWYLKHGHIGAMKEKLDRDHLQYKQQQQQQLQNKETTEYLNIGRDQLKWSYDLTKYLCSIRDTPEQMELFYYFYNMRPEWFCAVDCIEAAVMYGNLTIYKILETHKIPKPIEFKRDDNLMIAVQSIQVELADYIAKGMSYKLEDGINPTARFEMALDKIQPSFLDKKDLVGMIELISKFKPLSSRLLDIFNIHQFCDISLLDRLGVDLAKMETSALITFLHYCLESDDIDQSTIDYLQHVCKLQDPKGYQAADDQSNWYIDQFICKEESDEKTKCAMYVLGLMRFIGIQPKLQGYKNLYKYKGIKKLGEFLEPIVREYRYQPIIEYGSLEQVKCVVPKKRSAKIEFVPQNAATLSYLADNDLIQYSKAFTAKVIATQNLEMIKVLAQKCRSLEGTKELIAYSVNGDNHQLLDLLYTNPTKVEEDMENPEVLVSVPVSALFMSKLCDKWNINYQCPREEPTEDYYIYHNSRHQSDKNYNQQLILSTNLGRYRMVEWLLQGQKTYKPTMATLCNMYCIAYTRGYMGIVAMVKEYAKSLNLEKEFKETREFKYCSWAHAAKTGNKQLVDKIIKHSKTQYFSVSCIRNAIRFNQLEFIKHVFESNRKDPDFLVSRFYWLSSIFEQDASSILDYFLKVMTENEKDKRIQKRFDNNNKSRKKQRYSYSDENDTLEPLVERKFQRGRCKGEDFGLYHLVMDKPIAQCLEQLFESAISDSSYECFKVLIAFYGNVIKQSTNLRIIYQLIDSPDIDINVFKTLPFTTYLDHKGLIKPRTLKQFVK
ncbi:hypothetical protein DFA_05862 [Cavenderia fasciculata]|uniref:Uncharacterized protein n=1 Tax=Cavenderia fasciculata TaxID=261658 RepID=F4PN38_CACFS|nr:uncharacterized protein DFA_05862 [Cavenderia fasciculata]EGG23728.1 hypothetical protein DFA_05862 [Cavenderia fasciculata]|eukprot:XP_004361579.1 hypothetical protein DFA_05862 [Cavenderia fasciculata]